MNVVVNGESRALPDGGSVQNLIDELQLGGQRLAVEVNREIVPRSRYEAHRLNEGDRVEIVRAIGGGEGSMGAEKYGNRAAP